MKTHLKPALLLVILAAVLVGTAITLAGTVRSGNGSNISGKDQAMQCNADDLTPYGNRVFINGVEVTDESAAVTYGDTIYFSISMIQDYVSDRFISLENGTVMIRRDTVSPSTLLACEEALYIGSGELTRYMHINNDVYGSTGNIFLDSTLPSSFNINGTTYYLTEEKQEIPGAGTEEADEVLQDGRGAWKDGTHYWVEDDQGNVYKYEKSGTVISTI